MPKKSTALVRYDSLKTTLQSGEFQQEVGRAMPERSISPDRLVRVALSAIVGNERLMMCTKESVLHSVLQAAQLGLEPDGVLGQAYIIPYKDKNKGLQAQLQLGYKGLIQLAHRSGRISSMAAELVYSKEKFSVQLGTARCIVHFPIHDEKGQGEFIGAYATAHFKDGTYDFEYMTKAQIDRIRKSSRAADGDAWTKHYDEMARKTAIRRLAKRLPLSPDNRLFVAAAIADEYAEAGHAIRQLIPEQPIDVKGFVEEEAKPEGKVISQEAHKEEKVPGPSPAAAVPREEAATESAAPARISIRFSGKKALDPAYISGPLPGEIEDGMPAMKGEMQIGQDGVKVWQVPACWISQITEELDERGIAWKEE